MKPHHLTLDIEFLNRHLVTELSRCPVLLMIPSKAETLQYRSSKFLTLAGILFLGFCDFPALLILCGEWRLRLSGLNGRRNSGGFGRASRTEAARAAGIDRLSVSDWLHRYNDEGVLARLPAGRARGSGKLTFLMPKI